MAIVFISPKQKQKTIIFGIVGIISLVLVIIGLMVFLKKPETVPPEQVFKAPKIEINFEILESDKLKNLEDFEGLKNEFNYQATTKDGELQPGKILAVSRKQAIKSLEDLGFSDIVLEEGIEVGRENPFVIYEIIPSESATPEATPEA